MKEEYSEFHKRYRPDKWENFFGNKDIVEGIQKNLSKVHLYLLHGDRGCGKTTLARIIARELKIDQHEVHEMDAASNRGINEVRELQQIAWSKPMFGQYKIFIIDECHRLTGDAKDALLKILEEPPAHVFFVMCTTEPAKVITTIKSRAKAGEFRVKRLERSAMNKLLDRVIKEEKLDIAPNVRRHLTTVVEGIPRDALGLLYKIKDMEPDQAIETLKGSNEEIKEVINICRILMESQGSKYTKWGKIRPILKDVQEDAETIRRIIMGYMSAVYLNNDTPDKAHKIMSNFLEPIYDKGVLYWSIFESC